MKITTTKKALDKLKDMLECAVIFNYSGRSMYGATCVAFATDEGAAFPALMLCAAAEMKDFDDGEDELIDLLQNPIDCWEFFRDLRQDNLGYSSLYYFPSLEIIEADQDDNNEEEEYSL